MGYFIVQLNCHYYPSLNCYWRVRFKSDYCYYWEQQHPACVGTAHLKDHDLPNLLL